MLSKLYDGYLRITNATLHNLMGVLVKHSAKHQDDEVQGIIWLNEVEIDGVSYPYNLGFERRSVVDSGDRGFHNREVIRKKDYFAHEITIFIDDVPVTAFLEGGAMNIKITYNSVTQAHQIEVLIKVLDAITPLVTESAIVGSERVFEKPAKETAYSIT